jgi:RimJ/RimL family protein N-acetyltransferase
VSVLTPDTPLTTRRMYLAALREKDAAQMAVVLADARLHEFIGGAPASPQALARRYRRLAAGSQRQQEQWLNWIVRLRTTGVPIGTVQATVTLAAGGEHAAEVAWVIGVPWQGRGFASEASAALVGWLRGSGVATITARIHPQHRASERVAQRAGMRLTAAVVDGERVWQLRGGRLAARHMPGLR